MYTPLFILCNNPLKSFLGCIKTEHTWLCLSSKTKMQILHHEGRFALATEAYLWACDYIPGLPGLMKQRILKNN